DDADGRLTRRREGRDGLNGRELPQGWERLKGRGGREGRKARKGRESSAPTSPIEVQKRREGPRDHKFVTGSTDLKGNRSSELQDFKLQRSNLGLRSFFTAAVVPVAGRSRSVALRAAQPLTPPGTPSPRRRAPVAGRRRRTIAGRRGLCIRRGPVPRLRSRGRARRGRGAPRSVPQASGPAQSSQSPAAAFPSMRETLGRR